MIKQITLFLLGSFLIALGQTQGKNELPTLAYNVVYGDIVINEIMQNPNAVTDGNGEYFEVINISDGTIDMNGWLFREDDGTNDSVWVDNGGPLLIASGEYLVFGVNADFATNGGVNVDYVYGTSSEFALANSADELLLETAEGVLIDEVRWDGGPNWPDPTGKSMELFNPALDNDVGSNWSEATTPFGDGDLGSPGAENSTYTLMI